MQMMEVFLPEKQTGEGGNKEKKTLYNELNILEKNFGLEIGQLKAEMPQKSEGENAKKLSLTHKKVEKKKQKLPKKG